MTRFFITAIVVVLLGVSLTPSKPAYAGIHSAPIILQAKDYPQIEYHPVSSYQLFATQPDGTAKPIPFQIDELNKWKDYVLPNGPKNNAQTGNHVFDSFDELSFMGNDVGIAKSPTKWLHKKPNLLYKLDIKKNAVEGAVYIGIYFSRAPKFKLAHYVSFNLENAEIKTSRFNYRFDKKNYLVVRGVNLKDKDKLTQPLITSSTFYLKADLKYFLTLEVNHRDVDSKLDAYKVGPIRSIVRVSFNYSMFKLNFDLGMYTEVSFFSNAVILPAVMYNPLDGGHSLNRGSSFYYGFSVFENPSSLNFRSNMPEYKKSNLLDFLKPKEEVKPIYWVAVDSSKYFMYMEVSPSKQMRRVGNIPKIYKENISAKELATRDNNKAAPLGKSPVNLALSFDLTQFDEGEHTVAFRLFFENNNKKSYLDTFKTLSDWQFSLSRSK